MFVHFNNKIINSDRISSIDCENYCKNGEILVMVEDMYAQKVSGAEATTLIMTLCPAVLEGKEAEYKRHAWAIHNLIGHPLMQILSWLHLTALGIKIHDATIPDPKGHK